MAPSAAEDDGTRRKRSRREESPPGKEGRARYSDVNAKESGARDRYNERDRRHSRRPRDTLPVEPSSGVGTSVTAVPEKKVEREKDGGTRRTSFDRTDAPPRSRSYLQHDDRGSARHGGRTNDRRASDHGRWEDSKEKPTDKGEKTAHDPPKKDDPAHEKDNKDKSGAKVSEKELADVLRKKNEQSHPPADDKNVWKHDRFYELETEGPARRRPPFREKKEFVQNATCEMEAEAGKPPRPDRSGFNSFRKEDGRGYYPRRHERYGRPPWDLGDRDFHKGEGFSQKNDPPRYGIQPRDRYNAGANLRGRERFNGRYSGGNSYNSSDVQVEKWKHDMFEDANRSPTPKNEEDQIAKVEALLAL